MTNVEVAPPADSPAVVRIVYDDKQHIHNKASECYVEATFTYADGSRWNGWIPIEYRRTGTPLTTTEEIAAHLQNVSLCCRREARAAWSIKQVSFWNGKKGAHVTRGFFDALAKTFQWTPVSHDACAEYSLPANPNGARRIQDLKDFGYTLSTDTNRPCLHCEKILTHVLLVPIPRGGISGYETWPPVLRRRIIMVLGGYDVYEGKPGRVDGLLPDHKFPEIRWDEQTPRESLAGLTNEEIQRDFQLLSNQRNQQKREVCRRCFQEKQRGFPFGIKFYYHGTEDWPEGIPARGKDAEQGCLGCGWYDMERWRQTLNQAINAADAGETDESSPRRVVGLE